MWLFTVGGREGPLHFPDVYSKTGDKNKALGAFSGSACAKLNTEGRQMPSLSCIYGTKI